MGAGASTGADAVPSTEDISKWSKEEVSEQVAAIGPAFEPYREIVMNEGIDGATLLDVDDDDLQDYGVSKKAHRKRIMKKIEDTKSAPTPAAAVPAAEATGAAVVSGAGAESAAARRFSQANAATKLFMSYPRGEETTPFAKQLKAFLESRGFEVWMDEEGIAGGADFMSAIGGAIKASRGIVAIIDTKFCGSAYCNNELAMAQGNNLQLFPILFRGLTFDQLPDGLQYMLASTNVIPFPEAGSDEDNMSTMHEHMCKVFAIASPTGPRRHGDSSNASATTQDQVTADAPSPLANVPVTVPELPDVVCDRQGVLSSMISNLLGFMGTGAVSLSSVKKRNKLSSHGSGGAGKTTLAAMLVHDTMVRRAFDRIGWISVGQTPDIMEMQRALFTQLTGEPLTAKAGATPESQLTALKDASAGKRWLVVLDDVWDSSHEKLLNCVDDSTPSKLFVTTRIRGLLKGCDEIALELLTCDEAVDLLLRTGGVEGSDEARSYAAQIVQLCGNLPLFVSICGGIIADYEGGSEWQTELIEMLEEDRLMVMGAMEDEEGEAADRVVGTSLAMLKNDMAQEIFQMLGLCPEDIPIPMEAVALVWKACLPEHAAKANAMGIRKVCKLLLDRNLLMGSTASGVHLHDIVRDYMRNKFEDDTARRNKQQCIIDAVIAATPEQDWQQNTPLGDYVRQSLRQHMVEAMPEGEARNDRAVWSWLDASERVDRSFVVKTAANIVGADVLEAMAADFEARGDYLQAALRLVCAANTVAVLYGMAAANLLATAEDRTSRYLNLRLRALALLEQAKDLSATVRSVHVSFVGKMMTDYAGNVELRAQLISTLGALITAGDHPDTVAECSALSYALFGMMIEKLGYAPIGAGNHLDIDSLAEAGRAWGKTNVALYRQAYEIAVRDNMDSATQAHTLLCVNWWAGCSWPFTSAEFADDVAWMTHERYTELLKGYEFATVNPKQIELFSFDLMFTNSPDVRALLCFGDIPLARRFVRKLATTFEGVSWTTVPTLGFGPILAAVRSSSFFAEIGTNRDSLTLLETFGCSFEQVQGTFEFLEVAFRQAGSAWSVEHEQGVVSFFQYAKEMSALVKVAHCLHTPEKFDGDSRRAFLDAYIQAKLSVDAGFDNNGFLNRADIVRAMESVERYDDGIKQAQWMLKTTPHNPCQVVEAQRALGRCYAKLGHTAEAQAAFDAAIAEAMRTSATYHEVLARCDYIQAVLDPADRRAEQLAPLGKAIKALVLDPSEYDVVLGRYGLDSGVVVAAHESQ